MKCNIGSRSINSCVFTMLVNLSISGTIVSKITNKLLIIRECILSIKENKVLDSYLT